MKLSKIIKHVMSSASEAKTAAIFYNCKAALSLRVSLEKMGHEQQKTPVITDNTTACGIIKKTIIPKRAKSYDMRFNCLKYREAQNRIDLIWIKGSLNRENYHSKRHPTNHYIRKRGEYVVAMPLTEKQASEQ